MGFDEGRIVFNSETGVYFSGQTVYGKLIFDQETEKTFRGIYVKVKGICSVEWRTTHSRTVNGKRETYHETHHATEEYINQKIYLIGSEDGTHTIQPGHYEYPFQFLIPPQCPSSFEGKHGHVRYEVKAVVDRAFKMDQEKKAVIRVIAVLDLNTVPGIDEPVQFSFNERYYCCCTSSGSVKAVVKLPAAGYCPGQRIPIEVSCNNSSSVNIDSITFTLKKDIKFHAQGLTKFETENIAQMELDEIAANSSRTFNAEMAVPDVESPNMVNCRYIDVEYRIKVTLCPDGCHSNSSQRHKIVIGTVPLRSLPFTPNPQTQMIQQNVPSVNVPASFPGTNVGYPGGSPYPGQNAPYPSNTPYPGPQVSPYPNTNPYTDNPPSYNEIVGANTSYVAGPSPAVLPSKSPYPASSPYPTASPYPTTSPYPSASPLPTNSPYPASNSPYPATNSPYPASNAPYPATNSPYSASNSPYPASNLPLPPSTPATNPTHSTPKTTISTGVLGFTAQGSDNTMPSMPSLPPGAAVPYPMGPPSNPFAAASAPAPT